MPETSPNFNLKLNGDLPGDRLGTESDTNILSDEVRVVTKAQVIMFASNIENVQRAANGTQ